MWHPKNIKFGCNPKKFPHFLEQVQSNEFSPKMKSKGLSLQQSKQALERPVSPCSHPAAPYPKNFKTSNTNNRAYETTSQTQ